MRAFNAHGLIEQARAQTTEGRLIDQKLQQLWDEDCLRYIDTFVSSHENDLFEEPNSVTEDIVKHVVGDGVGIFRYHRIRCASFGRDLLNRCVWEALRTRMEKELKIVQDELVMKDPFERMIDAKQKGLLLQTEAIMNQGQHETNSNGGGHGKSESDEQIMVEALREAQHKGGQLKSFAAYVLKDCQNMAPSKAVFDDLERAEQLDLKKVTRSAARNDPSLNDNFTLLHDDWPSVGGFSTSFGHGNLRAALVKAGVRLSLWLLYKEALKLQTKADKVCAEQHAKVFAVMLEQHARKSKLDLQRIQARCTNCNGAQNSPPVMQLQRSTDKETSADIGKSSEDCLGSQVAALVLGFLF